MTNRKYALKVLSYNIHYKTASTNLQHCTKVSDTAEGPWGNTCIKKISQFIQTNAPYDFVCLQEASNWKHLQKVTPALANMNKYNCRLDVEELITFYDKAHTLDKTYGKLCGKMCDNNRPLLILFFNNNLCIINIHAGHNRDAHNFELHLENLLQQAHVEYTAKIMTYDIIVAGDFNDELKGLTFTILGRQLSGQNIIPTCCGIMRDKNTVAFDHILSSHANNSAIVHKVQFASDHMPIIAYISKNIGYDFDGVLHSDVAAADQNGERHPNTAWPYKPFDKIISKIDSDIRRGNNVYIITARPYSKQNYFNIMAHLESTALKLHSKNIPIYFTAGHNKSAMLSKLKIDTFYDDSPLRIHEIQAAIADKKLKYLQHLYIVKPEAHTWKRIAINNSSLGAPENIIDRLTKIYALTLITHDSNAARVQKLYDKFMQIFECAKIKYGFKIQNYHIKYLIQQLDELYLENKIVQSQKLIMGNLFDSINLWHVSSQL